VHPVADSGEVGSCHYIYGLVDSPKTQNNLRELAEN